MRNLVYHFFMLTFAVIFCLSCSHQKRQEQVIKNYYAGFNSGNFRQIGNCISDSMVVGEMEYLISHNQKELYHLFQWDSVFQPEYKILDIKKDSSHYVATVWKTCQRIYFLQDTAITFRVRIDFKGNRISGIRLTEYMDLNFDKWQYRTEALIAYIDQNHPELSGFNNDLTKSGALHYLVAVKLFNEHY